MLLAFVRRLSTPLRNVTIGHWSNEDVAVGHVRQGSAFEEKDPIDDTPIET